MTVSEMSLFHSMAKKFKHLPKHYDRLHTALKMNVQTIDNKSIGPEKLRLIKALDGTDGYAVLKMLEARNEDVHKDYVV